jgi:phosphoserine phosphatase RsbU/P
MIKKHSLSFRIITRVLLITITLFVVIFSGYYYYTRSIIREASRDYAIQLAGNLVGKIERELQPMEKIPQMIGATMELGLFHEDSLINILEAILHRNPNIYGACIAFEPGFYPEKGTYFMPYAYRDNGKIETLFLGGGDYQYFFMDWYQIPKILEAPFWSEPYYDEGGGNILMATYSVPFYTHLAAGRRFSGIATVDVALERLTDFVSEVKIFETGYAFMISRNGVAVTHPDKSQIMNSSIFSIADEWNAPILREIGRDLMQGKSNFREYNIPGRDKQWIYYTNLASNQWSIGVIYPDDEMFASLNRMTTFLIVLIVAGLLLLTILTVNIINRLASPLAHFAQSARLVAEGNFDVELPTVKTKDEMLELRKAFSHMQHQLAAYIENLKETTSAKEKIESELRIARDIQMSMIPHSFPPFPDLPQVDLFAMLKSAKEVGGDLYDFFLMDNNKFCFAIGDVSGKGVPASLFMAVTRTLLRSISDKYKTPSDIMKVLNKSLAMNNDSCMFVTFFLGILDLSNGDLSFTNAGHNPPVLIRKNGEAIFFEHTKSIPLGLQEEYPYTETLLNLGHGDKIFTYTDGVSEAENVGQQLFGDEAVLKTIAENTAADPRQLIEIMDRALEQHVSGFAQSDDITMMTISYHGKAI